MKIIIEYLEESVDGKWKGWCVTVGEKYADGLTYDEMLGLIAATTMPDSRPCLQWLKSNEEHQAFKHRYDNKQK